MSISTGWFSVCTIYTAYVRFRWPSSQVLRRALTARPILIPEQVHGIPAPLQLGGASGDHLFVSKRMLHLLFVPDTSISNHPFKLQPPHQQSTTALGMLRAGQQPVLVRFPDT